VVGILRQCDSLGCTVNAFLRDCGEAALPWWAEAALWRGFAYLFGPGGRERIGTEFASLKYTVAAAVGAKTKPEDHMLYRFPDLAEKSREANTMDAYWALRKIAVTRKPETSG
jgi:hypothetical protein